MEDSIVIPFVLTYQNGDKKTFTLKKDAIVIGRSKDANITIVDDLASRFHCRIFRKGNELFIEDLGSKNGLFINGTKTAHARIYLSDAIKVGHIYIKIDSSSLPKNAFDILMPEHTMIGVPNLRLENTNERDLRGDVKLINQGQNYNQEKPKTKKYKSTGDNFKSKSYLRSDYSQEWDPKSLVEIKIIDRALILIAFYIPFLFSFIFSTSIFKQFHSQIIKLNIFVVLNKEVFPVTAIGLLFAVVFNYINREMLYESIGETVIKKNKLKK